MRFVLVVLVVLLLSIAIDNYMNSLIPIPVFSEQQMETICIEEGLE